MIMEGNIVITKMKFTNIKMAKWIPNALIDIIQLKSAINKNYSKVIKYVENILIIAFLNVIAIKYY